MMLKFFKDSYRKALFKSCKRILISKLVKKASNQELLSQDTVLISSNLIHTFLGLNLIVNMKPLVKIEGTGKRLIHYNVKISTKTNILDQKRGAIELKPGYHVSIRVTPKVIDASEDFVAFDVDTRNCKLPYETDELKFLQNYTKDGCELECALNKSLSVCKCLPWYLPNNFNEASMCDMFGAKCVDTIISDQRNYKNCKEQCLEDCKITSYAAIPSYVPIDPEQTCAEPIFKAFFGKMFENNPYEMNFERMTMGKWKDWDDQFIDERAMDLCQDYVSKYISIVTVETPVNSVVKAKRVARITFNDKLAAIGGTLGLFSGISILSMVEVVCFCLTITKRFCQMESCELSKKTVVTQQEKNDKKIDDNYVVENLAINRATNQATKEAEYKIPSVS